MSPSREQGTVPAISPQQHGTGRGEQIGASPITFAPRSPSALLRSAQGLLAGALGYLPAAELPAQAAMLPEGYTLGPSRVVGNSDFSNIATNFVNNTNNLPVTYTSANVRDIGEGSTFVLHHIPGAQGERLALLGAQFWVTTPDPKRSGAVNFINYGSLNDITDFVASGNLPPAYGNHVTNSVYLPGFMEQVKVTVTDAKDLFPERAADPKWLEAYSKVRRYDLEFPPGLLISPEGVPDLYLRFFMVIPSNVGFTLARTIASKAVPDPGAEILVSKRVPGLEGVDRLTAPITAGWLARNVSPDYLSFPISYTVAPLVKGVEDVPPPPSLGIRHGQAGSVTLHWTSDGPYSTWIERVTGIGGAWSVTLPHPSPFTAPKGEEVSAKVPTLSEDPLNPQPLSGFFRLARYPVGQLPPGASAASSGTGHPLAP